MGHLVQMAGLAVQNFLSAAVGIAVGHVDGRVRGFLGQQHVNVVALNLALFRLG